MISGKKLRMNKIFQPDGKAVVVALDHASGAGPMPGIENPKCTVEKLIAGGVDAIMTTPGIIANFGDKFGRAGVILRADGGSTALGDGGGFGKLFGAEMVLSLGADAICTMGFAGAPHEYEHWSYITSTSQECQKLQVPYLVEALPRGEKAKSMPMENAVSIACRVSAELGADFIKTAYPGTPEAMRKVVNECYIPILVLGGPKADNKTVLELVQGAMEGGAAGVCFGRNLWSHPHPEQMVAAISEVVHGGKSVDEALRQL